MAWTELLIKTSNVQNLSNVYAAAKPSIGAPMLLRLGPVRLGRHPADERQCGAGGLRIHEEAVRDALDRREEGGDLLEAQGLLVRHEEGVHPGDRAVDAPERAHRAPGFDELPDGLVLHRAFRIFRTTFYVKGARWA